MNEFKRDIFQKGKAWSTGEVDRTATERSYFIGYVRSKNGSGCCASISCASFNGGEIAGEKQAKHVSQPLTYFIFRFLSRPHLERIVNALRAHGEIIDESLLQYLSPLGWEHINLTGDYVWRTKKVGPGKFRPIRIIKNP